MTTMQAVTVFAGSDMPRSFSLSFRTLAEGGRRAKRRTVLLRAGIACQIWAMSSPRDFIDDSDDYWRRDERTIKIHGPEGFEGMRRAGRLAAETLDFITPYVQPGISTGELDKLCHDFILDHKAIPAPLGYRGYPEVDLHLDQPCGLPRHPGRQAPAGRRHRQYRRHRHPRRLVRRHQPHVLRRRGRREGAPALRRHLRGDDARHRRRQAGRPVGDIGHAIQTYVEAQRFSVVRDFSGHGLGRIFHDAPNILHYGKPGTGPVLKPGMFFTVEPMVNAGTWQVKILSDGWTAVTRDKQLSAQFEHSVGITETGVEFFTLSPKGLAKPPYDLGRQARRAAPAAIGLRTRQSACNGRPRFVLTTWTDVLRPRPGALRRPFPPTTTRC